MTCLYIGVILGLQGHRRLRSRCRPRSYRRLRSYCCLGDSSLWRVIAALEITAWEIATFGGLRFGGHRFGGRRLRRVSALLGVPVIEVYHRYRGLSSWLIIIGDNRSLRRSVLLWRGSSPLVFVAGVSRRRQR